MHQEVVELLAGERAVLRRALQLHEAIGLEEDDVGVDAGVEELVFHLLPGPPAIGRDEVVVGKGRLGVLVEVLHVRVGRRAVEVEVVLLHVLAVVPLTVGEAEQPLFEDRSFPFQRARHGLSPTGAH